jgi:hypothetical protein
MVKDMVKIEGKEESKSKVIIGYAAFISTLTGILIAGIGIWSYLASIKTDIVIIKDQHEFRIRLLETNQKILDLNDRSQDTRIHIIETENKYKKENK